MGIKNRINTVLRRWNVELHGLGYLQSLAKGEFKSNEYDYFKKIFGNNAEVIFDVGANRGLTVENFLNNFPKAKIYAFEPVEELYSELKDKYSGNSNVQISANGISNKPGSLKFFINKSLDTSSLLPSKITGLNSDEQVSTVKTVQVPVRTIDDAVLEFGLDKIDILKLDIQGGELNALKGAEILLKQRKISLIYTEAYFIQQYVEQPLFYDIAQYLLPFGYAVQDIYNPVYGKGKLAWCDAVFVKVDLV